MILAAHSLQPPPGGFFSAKMIGKITVPLVDTGKKATYNLTILKLYIFT